MHFINRNATVRTSDPRNAPVRGPQHQPNGPIVVTSPPQLPNRSLLSPFSRKKITAARAAALRRVTPVFSTVAGGPTAASPPCPSVPARLDPSSSRLSTACLPPSPPRLRPAAAFSSSPSLLHRSSDSSRLTRHGLLHRSSDSSRQHEIGSTTI